MTQPAQSTSVDFDWPRWALDVAKVCSTVRSARRGIERAMDDYARLAVERDRYREALAYEYSHTLDDATKWRIGAALDQGGEDA